MGRRATLKQVAAEVGVSPATVSNAYNRPDQLSEELRERVFGAARRLGYAGPDAMARGLRRRRAGAVGVLYSDRLSYAFADPAAVEFLRGVSVATEEAGLGMLLVPGSSMADRNPRAVGEAVVDGFVIYCMAEGDPLATAALERRSPAVLVDRPGSGQTPSVGIDDVGAARAVAEHVIGLGHERLAVVSFELSPGATGGLADARRRDAATYLPARFRLEGYAQAVEAAGLSWEDVPVYECAENVPSQGAEAARVLLATSPRPTALLCLSDQLAMGVLEAAREGGVSVPKELSVVGFDDIPQAARSEPPLTTVNQPHAEKGFRAGSMLIAQLRGEAAPPSEVLPTELVVRGSTARPRRGAKK
jgi:DNA-binding LacI/PurR family transcriptional regulator